MPYLFSHLSIPMIGHIPFPISYVYALASAYGPKPKHRRTQIHNLVIGMDNISLKQVHHHLQHNVTLLNTNMFWFQDHHGPLP